MRSLELRRGPFHRIGDRYGHFIDQEHFLGRDALEDGWMTGARANISKNEEGYSLELALPGFKKEDISVKIEDNFLYVSASRTPQDQFMIHQEVPNQVGKRAFELPANIDQRKITAKLDHGMLKTRIPKEPGAGNVLKTIEVM